MTTSPRYHPVDALLHVRTRLEYLTARVRPEAAEDSNLAVVCGYLDALGRDVDEHLAVFGAAGCGQYTTGVPVASVLHIQPGAAGFVWCWHPRTGHPSNLPHVITAAVDVGGGEVVDVIVSGPGALDVIRRPTDHASESGVQHG